MQSKILFVSIAFISLILSVLPEFISDEVKSKVKGIFGNHYDWVWLIIFLSLSVLFFYLTWKQAKLDYNKHPLNVTESISSKKVEYKINQRNKYGDNMAGNKIVKK